MRIVKSFLLYIKRNVIYSGLVYFVTVEASKTLGVYLYRRKVPEGISVTHACGYYIIALRMEYFIPVHSFVV